MAETKHPTLEKQHLPKRKASRGNADRRRRSLCINRLIDHTHAWLPLGKRKQPSPWPFVDDQPQGGRLAPVSFAGDHASRPESIRRFDVDVVPCCTDVGRWPVGSHLPACLHRAPPSSAQAAAGQARSSGSAGAVQRMDHRPVPLQRHSQPQRSRVSDSHTADDRGNQPATDRAAKELRSGLGGAAVCMVRLLARRWLRSIAHD